MKKIFAFLSLAVLCASAPLRDFSSSDVLVAPDYTVRFKQDGILVENQFNYERYSIIPEWIIEGPLSTKLSFTDRDVYTGKLQNIGVTKTYHNSTLAFHLEMQGNRFLITTSFNNWDFKQHNLTLGIRIVNLWYNRTLTTCGNSINLDGFLKFKLDNNAYTESGIHKIETVHTDGMYYIKYPAFNQTLYHFSELSFEHRMLDIIFTCYLLLAIAVIGISSKKRKLI